MCRLTTNRYLPLSDFFLCISGENATLPGDGTGAGSIRCAPEESGYLSSYWENVNLTHREYVLKAISHEQTDRIPYTLRFEKGMEEELDQYYGSPTWRNKLQQCIRGVGSVDTTVGRRVDNSFAIDAFGSLWRVDVGAASHLEKPAIAGTPSFDGIQWPKSDDFPINLDDDILACTGPDARQASIIKIPWGLFEQSWRIRGFENVMMDCVTDVDFYEELLDRLTELYLAHVERCRSIPADAIMFMDDWGDQRGVILGPERWRKYLKPRWARLYAAVHDQGKLVISHCCGSFSDILPDIIEIGLDVIESVQPEPRGMDPFELKRRFGSEITFWGCLGSQSTIPFGTPDEIRARVEELCRVMGRGGGYILAPAKEIQPGTPASNSAAVVEAFARNNL